MKAIRFVSILCFLFVATSYVVFAADSTKIRLTSLVPFVERQDFGALSIDKGLEGQPLKIKGQSFGFGFGTHANSDIRFELEQDYDVFECTVGVDDVIRSYGRASVVFKILGDNKELFKSETMTSDTPPVQVSVSVLGVDELRLVVEDADGSVNCDHADWAEPALIRQTEAPALVRDETVAHRFVSSSTTAEFSANGELLALIVGKNRLPIQNQTRLLGCTKNSLPVVKKLPNGGIEIAVQWKHRLEGHEATLTERFLPTAHDSIRWELEVQGHDTPWTTPIQFGFQYLDASEQTRFWSAWSDPRCNQSRPNIDAEAVINAENGAAVALFNAGGNWGDPLLPQPLSSVRLYYGLTPMTFDQPGIDPMPFRGDLICIPMLSLLTEKDDLGLSMVLDFEDKTLDITLDVTPQGDVLFRHLNHRICKDVTQRFNADLVPHESDWRSGLRWTVERYRPYFDPCVEIADEVVGTASYATPKGVAEICADPERFHKMAYGVNWQASFDFPYMGMFIPPLDDESQTWKAFGGWQYSVGGFNKDAKRIKDAGFHTLSYFNVTEFGAHIPWPLKPKESPDSKDIWKDSSAMLSYVFPNAYVRRVESINPETKEITFGGLVYSWLDCILMDAGDPEYKKYLLEQGQRHLEKVPDAYGICIDRLDWLRYYNHAADDGVSWYHGLKGRYLLFSWHELIEPLAKKFHGANKVIYVNNHNKRIDALRYIDGIYDEFTYAGAPANLTALLCLRKPAMAWTASPENLKPDPDAFFQRHLYLGMFPTAPIPHNDHALTPNAEIEPFYFDYAPLLETLRGKKWVLTPHVLTVNDRKAKANIFETPQGYVIPVVFAGEHEQVELILRNLGDMNEKTEISVLYPGEESVKTTLTGRFNAQTGEFHIDVPMQRQCGMLLLTWK